MASAPPEPPSLTTIVMIGTFKPAIAVRFVAIASLWPAVSASKEGQAPTVSTKVTTGKPNRSARPKNAKQYGNPVATALHG